MGGKGKGWYYKAKYGGGGGGNKGDRGGAGGAAEDDGPSGKGGGAMEVDEQWSASSIRTRSSTDLETQLRQLDGRQYPAYKGLEQTKYQFPSGFDLTIDKAQNDPFAPPSKMRIFIPSGKARFPSHTRSSRIRRVALADFLVRAFWEGIHQVGLDEFKGAGGGYHSQKGGEINVERPSQHVLERTSCTITHDGDVEVRFLTSLPGHGRTIEGHRGADILCKQLPEIVQKTLFSSSHPEAAIRTHLDSVEDQEALRNMLRSKGLVGFVRDGATLPRRSGDDDRPLVANRTAGIPAPVAFSSPDSLRVEFQLPHRGKITGMGIRKGVTLIVGGGFHGKSTLLRALEVGIYNHVPGDGRDFVCVDPTAMKIRAEDKRAVASVDISPFLNNLPLGKGTRCFSTQDASGSTSQAANIMEALEIGCSCLLIDEDTCATNFMIRDRRMQMLVAKDKEPITPFVLKVRQLLDEMDVSTICVIGGAGDYLEVADTVIMMDTYEPRDVTEEAQAVCKQLPMGMGEKDKTREAGTRFGDVVHRGCNPQSIATNLGGKAKVMPRGLRELVFGDAVVDLSFVEQIVERAQVQAIGDALQHLSKLVKPSTPLRKVLQQLDEAMGGNDANSLDVIKPGWAPPHGSYARPRALEIAAALNRLRTVEMEQLR